MNEQEEKYLHFGFSNENIDNILELIEKTLEIMHEEAKRLEEDPSADSLNPI